jgi:hypothetical protein
MRAHTRLPHAATLACCVAFAACGPGTAGPPALAYRLPDPARVTYLAGDSLSVEIQALGQTLALEMGSTAEYGVSYERAADGLTVTLRVLDLEVDVSLPLVGPLHVEEEIVEGDLVLALDPRGDVTILQSPEVEEAASTFFAGPTIANTFFPGLPGRAVSPGDSWVDTVAFAEDGDSGEQSQRFVTTYTLVGEAVVEGRSLVEITFEGTAELRQTMSMQGAAVEQETQMTVEGRVLWDMQRGLMFERESVSRGTGTVRVAAMPMPLPTQVESRSRARLRLP